MKASDHVEINEKNSLHQMMLKLKTKKTKEELDDIWLTYFSFKTTFSFLPEIWNRIQCDIKLIADKNYIEGTYYSPDAEEGSEPTEAEKKILKECKEHEDRIILDTEDWFIHSHILMDKFAKLIKKIFLLFMTEEKKQMILNITDKSFYEFKDYFVNKDGKIIDEEFYLLMMNYTKWFEPDLKNIRDDMIQHESVPKIWGSSIDSRNNDIAFGYSKFRPYMGFLEKTYQIRDRNITLFPQIKDNQNYFELLVFFEEHSKELKQKDKDLLKFIKKSYGGKIPDIILLYEKMSDFFTRINDYFVNFL